MNTGEKNLVLVVDDDLSGLLATTKKLEREGFEIITARTGQEALAKAHNFPDIVILDIKLPDISGFEVCRILRADPMLSNLPIIHLSATYLDTNSRVQGLKGGADGFLTHPVDSKVLAATIQSVLRIRHTEAKLQAAAHKWQTTFDAITDGVCLVDMAGIITQCNVSFTQMTGLSQSALAGFELCQAAPEFAKYSPEFFQEVITGEKKAEKEVIFLRDKWLQASIDVTLNLSGYYAQAVFKLNDITEKKEFEEKLQKTLHELERSNKELEQFAFVASHDLQEPLRMVSSYTELLARRYSGRFDENADQYIEFAVDGTKRMQHLIHDLLEYSRVTTKVKSLSLVDLNDVLKSVELNLQMSITSNNAVVKYDNLPVIVADETQMIQLFQNLITNALKFRSNRDPKITITAAEQQGELIIRISDNGIGIEKQYYERIFEIFQRLHLRSEYPGTGIGLAVCKKIVERHGGHIRVESEPGAGSTFYFTLSLNLQS